MDYLKGWNENRLYQPNRCSCEHCCTSSNICGYCKDFSQPINWKTSNPVDLKCTQCPKAYHRDCLPFAKRKPNSWQKCSDISEGYKCEQYLDFFTFLNKMPSNEQTLKYERIIYNKFNEIFPNKQIKIRSHFCGFIYNKFKYLIEDCTEILLNGSEQSGIARIIDIFTTENNNSYLAIQWYWHKNEFNKSENKNQSELYFENNFENLDIIAIETINCKVIVCDSETERNIYFEKLKQLNRKKCQEMKILKIKNKNEFNKLCLMENIMCYKSILFQKVFWSVMSCNGNLNNKQKYKTIENNTNKKRMEIQKQILNENILKIKTRKRKLNNEINIIQNKNKKIKLENNKHGIVSISYEEYNKLKTENNELQIAIERCKKYENEILLLQKSNAYYKNQMNTYEINGKKLKTEIIGLKQEINILNKDWEKKDENLNGKQMKITLGYKEKISELEFKINKLETTLNSKNEQIEWYRNERDKQRGNHEKINKNVNIIPFNDVTSIDSRARPSDPRKKDRVMQRDMNKNEMKRMF